MAEHIRKPDWLKIRLGGNETFTQTKRIVESHGLHTICTSGKCPNMGECWGRGTATFMIGGEICTRSCKFCNTLTGKPLALNPEEPANVAKSIQLMKLKHAVVTSVDRDDLPDQGAGHWVKTIQSIKQLNPETTLEVLIPDFQGNLELVDLVPVDEQDDAACDDQHGRRERYSEASPQGEMTVVALEGPGVGGEQAIGEARRHSRGQAHEREDPDGQAEPGVQPVLGGRLDTGFGREGAPPEAQGVADGEDRSDDDDRENQPLALMGEGLERGFLPDVAQRRGNTGHGRQRHRRRHGEAGHRASDTGKLAQIAGAVLVVDRADGQEQRGLEHRVRKKHGQPGQRDRALAVADQHHDRPSCETVPNASSSLRSCWRNAR